LKILVENLSKKFSSVTALEDINLSVKEGEIFGLLGPNGAGKTTLIKILATLIRPTSGKVTIDGLDLIKDKYKIREKIGLVSHETYLYEELTARENLEFYAKLYGVEKSVNNFLKKVGLEDKANILVKNFSRGMKQRLAIARAILHKPEILLFDEATTGLDIKSREKFYSMLQELRNSEVTIVLSTHHRSEAKLCDRLAYIEKKVLKIGEVNEVLSNSQEGLAPGT